MQVQKYALLVQTLHILTKQLKSVKNAQDIATIATLIKSKVDHNAIIALMTVT